MSPQSSQQHCHNRNLIIRSYWYIVQPLLLIVIFFFLVPVTAISTTSSSTTASQLLSTTRCRLRLEIGRVPGTAMPPEWAASGALLVLPNLDICFGEKTYQYGYRETEERIVANGDDPPRSIDVLSMPKFIGIQGEEIVTVQNGAFALKSHTKDDDRWPGISLHFFLDFPSGAVRNDVILPAERVFFTTKCWVDDRIGGEDNGDGGDVDLGSLQAALDRLKRTKDEYRLVDEEIRNFDDREKGQEEQEQEAQQQNASPPTKISEGTSEKGIVSIVRRLTGFRSRLQMSERRMALKQRIDIFERALPPPISLSDSNGDERKDDTIQALNGIIFMKEGYMTVKRYGGFMGAREEYHIVGKFFITDILDSA